MPDFRQQVPLGRTGLSVGRVGVGASYGVPRAALEAAFERGANFFYWGSIRREAMAEAIRALAPRHRDRMVVAVQSYARFGSLVRWSLARALRSLRIDYADVLLLGWYNRPPGRSVLDACERLKREGRVRFVAISCHERPTFQTYIKDGSFDILMVRYNAAHRGAEREVFPYLPPQGGPGVMAYTATRWGELVDPKCMPPGERVPRASDCYRFALSDPRVHLCLSGPKDAAEMEEALAALERGPMTEEELAWMRRVGDGLRESLSGRMMARG
ncbi:MAG: aldo/keto reductase [Planctomycetes bacterium]|nr:aldo/keto reductase [Planctomycetota bacterium]